MTVHRNTRKFAAHRVAVGVLAAALVVTAAGCSSDGGEDAETQGASGALAGSDLAAEEGSTEVPGPSPRLAAVDAAGRVVILDLETGDELTDFGGAQDARISAVDDRFAFLTAFDGDTTIVDVGSWSTDHGDHAHSYVKTPTELGEIEDAQGAHVVANDGKVAVFSPRGGAASVLSLPELRKGKVDVVGMINADASGVVIPMADHFVTSRDTETSSTFELRDSTSAVVHEFTDACPNFEGQAVFRTSIVAACDDGFVVLSYINAESSSRKIAYPEGVASGARPTTLRTTAGSSLVVGNGGKEVLVFDSALSSTVDGAEVPWTQIPTQGQVLDAALSGNGKQVLALLADGSLAVFDAQTGEQVASGQVLSSPFDTSAGAEAAPSFVVGANRAYVTEPAVGAVHEVDYLDNGRVARTFDVAATSLMVAGF
ncbi:MAG: ABC transporter [Rhodococcus sp.]|nr:ABC transporter [Rhodococcus sp. (in: high G+C Gram-positive bacteria)]